MGVDIFKEYDADATATGQRLEAVAGPDFMLQFVSARGTLVYPAANANIDTVGWWRCRFMAAAEGSQVTDAQILALIERVGQVMPWVHIQKLRLFEGEEGFTRAQGQ